MDNLIEINNVSIRIKEYNDQRVITFKDVDRAHQRPDGTARKAFNRNKKRFIKDEDYFMITREDEIPMSVSWTLKIPPKGITLITESGYLMISKVFDDDIAWDVQRKLVNTYFRTKQLVTYDPNVMVFQTMSNTITSIHKDISSLKETLATASNYQFPKPSYSPWYRKMQPKYEILQKYFGLTRKELYHKLFVALQETHPEIHIEELQEEYCYAYKVKSCFPMDAIEFHHEARIAFEELIEIILYKYDLSSQSSKTNDQIIEEIFAK